jgi:hypothetical protein
MANSKLLKEAIADAKAVKETALANAKLALEEAFTPRLQSMLSQKLRAEAEAEAEDAEMKNEELDSSEIGTKVDAGYPETPGKTGKGFDAHTDLSKSDVGIDTASGDTNKDAGYKKVADINEEMDDMNDDEKQNEIAQLKARLAELEADNDEDPNDESDEYSMDPDSDDDSYDVAGHEDEDADGMDADDMHHDEESEDDMDLEAIIRELEAQLEGDDMDGENNDEMGGEHEEDENMYEDSYSDGSLAGTDKSEDPKTVKVEKVEKDITGATDHMKTGSYDNTDEVIDLEEILREMEDDMKGDEDEKKDESLKKDLNEAYKTIKSLQNTINEVNLLNAKLLFANKLFRAHNMTNEQKVKVIETLDRTKSVREVKLVYSTLAENLKQPSITKATKKSMTEGIASKVTKSTKPAAKQVIAESTNFSNRFKKLAGIIK